MKFPNKLNSISSIPVNYYTEFSTDIFNTDNLTLLKYIPTRGERRCILIVDETVYEIYHNIISNYFDFYNVKLKVFTIPGGEENKNTDNLFKLLEFFEESKVLRRSEIVIGIGGGVILDEVGLACSLYRRGIPYVKIPTTLLGQVDVSIGIKTGINYNGFRNRIGTYYPHLCSIVDTTFLKTVKDREIISGFGEIFKISIIKNRELFFYLAKNSSELLKNKFNFDKGKEVIYQAIVDMNESLNKNPIESILERDVDFGHTFSPLIEMRSLESPGCSLLHGEAVALDVIFSSCISYNRGILPIDDLNIIFNTAKLYNLPTSHPFFSDSFLLSEALNETAKHRDGNQNLPIPTKIGSCKFLNDVSIDDIKKSISTLNYLNNA